MRQIILQLWLGFPLGEAERANHEIKPRMPTQRNEQRHGTSLYRSRVRAVACP